MKTWSRLPDNSYTIDKYFTDIQEDIFRYSTDIARGQEVNLTQCVQSRPEGLRTRVRRAI